MPSTSRASTLARPPDGYRDAFDAFTDALRSDQSRGCARAASGILLKSPSYKRIVGRLNREYLSADHLERRGGIMPLEPDDDGVLRAGPFSGRRTLTFTELTTGNRFIRAGSFQIQTTAFPLTDCIRLAFPMGEIVTEARRGEVVAGLVGSIAHETVHALHRVTGAGAPPSAGRAVRAAAFIDEEIATRKEEQEILAEILALRVGKRMALEIAEKEANSTGMREHLQQRVDTMTLSRPDVQRDFLSGSPLTYLETFVIEDLIERSIRVERLSGQKIEESRTVVDGLAFDLSIDMVLRAAHPELLTSDPRTGLKTVFLPTQLAELLLMRRVLETHWRESTDDRESILRSHEANVFPADIRYAALP